jgi:hypothetical protein
VSENKYDPTTAHHVCMPVLSVMGLLMFFLRAKRSCTFLHYDILPRYLRGVSRILRVPKEKIVSILSTLTGMPIHKIKHGDEVPGYRDLHLKTQETTSTIVEHLIPLLESSKWILLLEKLIGKKPAMAYTLKQVANYQIFPQLVPLFSCYLSLEEKGNYIAVWDYLWPEEWFDVVKNNLKNIQFEFFKWPKWYLSVSNFLFGLSLLPRLFIRGLFYLLKRGFSIKKIEKKHYKIITEFIDPERLNNTPYDADYWVDGKTVNSKDILFFITESQKSRLIRDGYQIKSLLDNVRAKGYEIEQLDDFSYPLTMIKKCWVLALTLLKDIGNVENQLIGNIFLKAWSEYLNFFPIFAYCHSENFIYLTFPNGRTDLRFNSGIVTGLCRNYGIRSVGCQTRAVHSKNYEYSFDCFDLYLAWGKVWYEMLGDGMRFVDEFFIVGCIYLDNLLPVYSENRNKSENRSYAEQLNVCIFPSDINPSGKHHYTLNYALSFMKNCAKLAIAHRDVNFVVKSKEPEYTKIVMSDREFMNLYQQTKNNFNFFDRARHEYSDLLFSSDIVIAVGFTTPGTEALLLGKRVIYYNELKWGGQAFNQIPDLIAGNFEALEKLFEKALYNYNKNTDVISSSLNELDPFRDGQALGRINKILVEGIE